MRFLILGMLVCASSVLCTGRRCSGDIIPTDSEQLISVGVATFSSHSDNASSSTLPPISLSAYIQDTSTTGFSEGSQDVLNYTATSSDVDLQVVGSSHLQLPVPPHVAVTSVAQVMYNDFRYDFTLTDDAFFEINASTSFQFDDPGVVTGHLVNVSLSEIGGSTLFMIEDNGMGSLSGVLGSGSYRVDAFSRILAQGKPAEPKDVTSQFDINFRVSNDPLPPIPEPSGLALFLSAFVGMVVVGRWQKRMPATSGPI